MEALRVVDVAVAATGDGGDGVAVVDGDCGDIGGVGEFWYII